MSEISLSLRLGKKVLYKEVAIIAPTASGKTALSIELAHKTNSVILSLDSLSVYRDIDIASAKPTLKERDGIVHFGIDKVLPNDTFDVIEFIEEYKNAKKYAKENEKNLIIVGGTGFYLKALVDGLSQFPEITQSVKDKVQEKIQDISKSYEYLKSIDKNYMGKIKSNDKYRIEKALQIFYATGLAPSLYLQKNKPQPIVEEIPIYEIVTGVDTLRQRIKKRTKIMLQNGLIEEVISLEKKYTRSPNAMKSIGIIETLEYLDSRITKQQLEELISIHTAQLAKRQRTFNKSQFSKVAQDSLENLSQKILKHF